MPPLSSTLSNLSRIGRRIDPACSCDDEGEPSAGRERTDSARNAVFRVSAGLREARAAFCALGGRHGPRWRGARGRRELSAPRRRGHGPPSRRPRESGKVPRPRINLVLYLWIAPGLPANPRHRRAFESFGESGGACVFLGECYDAKVPGRGALLSSGRRGWEWKAMVAIDGIKRVRDVLGFLARESGCESSQLPTGARDGAIADGFLLP